MKYEIRDGILYAEAVKIDKFTAKDMPLYAWFDGILTKYDSFTSLRKVQKENSYSSSFVVLKPYIPDYEALYGKFREDSCVGKPNIKFSEYFQVGDCLSNGSGKIMDINNDLGCMIVKKEIKLSNNLVLIDYITSRGHLNKQIELSKINISFNNWNTDISNLITTCTHFGVDLDPFYQRGLVWSQEQKEAFLQSIFDGLDLGQITLVKKSDFSREIMDGKQRLTTILDFYANRITFQGVYYCELSLKFQHRFKRCSIVFKETIDELTDKQKIEYFLRINNGGTVMDREHLEKLKKKL